MWSTLRDESPLNALCGTEIRDLTVVLLVSEESRQLRQLSRCSNEVRAVIAPNCGWFATSGNKTTQTGDESHRCEIGDKLQVNSLYGHGNENTDIPLHSGWLASVAEFKVDWTAPTFSNTMPGVTRSSGSCPRFWLGICSSACHTRTSDVANISALSNNVKVSVQ